MYQDSKLFIAVNEECLKYLCMYVKKNNCLYLKWKRDGDGERILFQVDKSNDNSLIFKSVNIDSKYNWYLHLDTDGFSLKPKITNSVFKVNETHGRLMNNGCIEYNVNNCSKEHKKLLKNKYYNNLYFFLAPQVTNQTANQANVKNVKHVNFSAKDFDLECNNPNYNVHHVQQPAPQVNQDVCDNTNPQFVMPAAVPFTPLVPLNKQASNSGKAECLKKNAVWQIDANGEGHCVSCNQGTQYPDRTRNVCVDCSSDPNVAVKCGAHGGYCAGTLQYKDNCVYNATTGKYSTSCVEGGKCSSNCVGKCGGKVFGMECVQDKETGENRCRLTKWWKLLLWIIGLILLILIIVGLSVMAKKKKQTTSVTTTMKQSEVTDIAKGNNAGLNFVPPNEQNPFTPTSQSFFE